MPFHRRGRLLDDGLAAMHELWRSTPATHTSDSFEFADVYCEPSPWRSAGPPLWFGGQGLHPPLLRRLVEHGSGFHPFGPVSDADLGSLAEAMAADGRSLSDLELIGGTRATFTGTDDVADLDAAMATIPEQIALGFTTFCMKPSQHTDDPEAVESLCRQMVGRLAELDTH